MGAGTDTAADRQAQAPRLLADIGGTNARFALYRDGQIRHLKVLSCAGYDSLASAMADYLDQTGTGAGQRPCQATIAVACPVEGDRFKLTNLPWAVSAEATRASLGLDVLHVINDFTALALALPGLDDGGRRRVGDHEPDPSPPAGPAPLALIGPGTGLGVSGLVWGGQSWVPLASEGGHVTYGAAHPEEAELLGRIGARLRLDHVSAERLLSGPGLVNIHQALAELHGSGAPGAPPEPAEILASALAGDDALCVSTLETFCAALGTAAGNLALTLR